MGIQMDEDIFALALIDCKDNDEDRENFSSWSLLKRLKVAQITNDFI